MDGIAVERDRDNANVPLRRWARGSSPGAWLIEEVRWLAGGRCLGFPGMSIGAEASDTESDRISCVSIEPGVGHLGDVGPCEVLVVALVSGCDSGSFSERQLEFSRQLWPSDPFPSTTASRLMAKDPGLNGSCIEGGIDALRLSSSLLLSTRRRDFCRGRREDGRRLSSIVGSETVCEVLRRTMHSPGM